MIHSNSIKQLHPTHNGSGDTVKSALSENLSQKNLPIQTISEQIGDKNYVYNQSGNRSWKAIVHLHGLVWFKENFCAQMSDPQLADYNHLAFDLHTDIQPNKKLHDRHELLRYIYDFLQAKGLQKKKIVLHGVSLGGEFAYKFAAKYPTMVDKVILSGASWLQHENLKFANIAIAKKLASNKTVVRGLICRQFENPEKIKDTIDILFEQIFALLNSKEWSQWVVALAKHTQKCDIQQNIEAIASLAEKQIPIHLLWWEKDTITSYKKVVPKFIEAGGIPQQHVHTFNTGHIPNLECAPEYNKILASIIKENSSD